MAQAEVFNASFIEKLNTEEGREKIAAYGDGIIRDHLREVSFARKILPPRPVTAAECQVSTEHDGLVKIEQLEPESRAVVVNFRGNAPTRYVRAPRVAVSFFSIETEHFEKTEQELLAYRHPITKMIEDQSATDIQEIEDYKFLLYVENAVQTMSDEAQSAAGLGAGVPFDATSILAGTVANGPDQNQRVMKGSLALANVAGGGSDDFVVYPILRQDLVNFFKLLDAQRLRMDLILLSESDFDDILQWTLEDVGDSIQSETVVNGYKYNTILGRRFIRSIKSDILTPGNIYGFTAPEFLGVFYVLNNTKFYVEKKGNKISWWSWEDIGMALLNINSVAKLELYSGSVASRAAVTIPASGPLAAARQPQEELDIGANINRAEEGLYVPLVTQF